MQSTPKVTCFNFLTNEDYKQNWVQKQYISIQIRIYLWSFIDYQHTQKHFYDWYITLSYSFICIINIRGNFIWKCYWYMKCPYLDSIILSTLKEVKRFQTGNLDPYNSILNRKRVVIPKKNDLWQKYASF